MVNYCTPPTLARSNLKSFAKNGEYPSFKYSLPRGVIRLALSTASEFRLLRQIAKYDSEKDHTSVLYISSHLLSESLTPH